jgi:hypothetical protein
MKDAQWLPLHSTSHPLGYGKFAACEMSASAIEAAVAVGEVPA